jgi:biotin carboxylase
LKKIMVLGASILQLPAIITAKKMGLFVIAVDIDNESIGFKEADICLEISTMDIPKVIEAAKAHKIDAIITLASDIPMRTVAAVSQEMGLVGIDVDTALKATNKAEMRQCLKENGVPVPVFYKVSTYDEYQQAVHLFQVPFIVKPADNSGSRGVFKIECAGDKEMVEYAYSYSKQYSRNGDIVVEEFMVGEEVSVETLSIDGTVHVIQITDKMTTGAPRFVEMGHSQPTHHSVEIVSRIHEVTTAAVNAIGIRNGPSHTEIIVTPNGPNIVELGARLGGDCITTHLVPLSTGINMVENYILIALGENPDITSKWQKGSAIRYMTSHKGILKSVTGLKEAEEMPYIQQVCLVKGIGTMITDVNSSVDRIGFVIAQDDNSESAVTACYNALDKIKIVIE